MWSGKVTKSFLTLLGNTEGWVQRRRALRQKRARAHGAELSALLCTRTQLQDCTRSAAQGPFFSFAFRLLPNEARLRDPLEPRPSTLSVRVWKADVAQYFPGRQWGPCEPNQAQLCSALRGPGPVHVAVCVTAVRWHGGIEWRSHIPPTTPVDRAQSNTWREIAVWVLNAG